MKLYWAPAIALALSATVGLGPAGTQPRYVADVHAVVCSVNRGEIPRAFEASLPLAGLLSRQEVAIPELSASVRSDIADIRLSLAAGHHYVDLRTSSCAAQIPIMARGDGIENFTAALRKDYIGYVDWPQDAWVTGCFPFSGVDSVELLSAAAPHSVMFVGRIIGRCYLIAPIALSPYLIEATLSDGQRTVPVPIPLRRHVQFNFPVTMLAHVRAN